MKKILPTLILLLILFCIVFGATAQTGIHHYYKFKNSDEQSVEKLNLPTNRAAFIFGNSNKNSNYTNPAIALLSNKSNCVFAKNIEINNTTVSSLIENNISEIKQENVCMFSNQTEDELWVQLNNNIKMQEDLNIEIYNAEGERVYNSIVDAELHKINVCNLTAGTFLVKLGDNVQKIIIE